MIIAKHPKLSNGEERQCSKRIYYSPRLIMITRIILNKIHPKPTRLQKYDGDEGEHKEILSGVLRRLHGGGGLGPRAFPGRRGRSTWPSRAGGAREAR